MTVSVRDSASVSKIVTSSWFAKLPSDIVRVSIARSAPRGQSGFRTYKKLTPGVWFRSVSDKEFTRRYYDEILDVLDPQKVVDELSAMAPPGGAVALLCWEPPEPGPQWCHRGLVSEWLHNKLGLEVREWGNERHGCGSAHPKMPPR